MGKAFKFLFFMQTLFLIGLLTFLSGFFPVPSNNQKIQKFEKPSSIGKYDIKPPVKQFTRTILLIIDAFRYDILNEIDLPFAYKNACSKLELKADIPTVTLPRIKSLITGTLSSFADIVANLGSADVLKDSLIHQIKQNAKSIIFAGDKVWVDLFQNIFKRQETNMDSFFVNDFYEGDAYVTTVIENELKNTDWEMFIVHYLGLDHIGHVEGSSSNRIRTKLREMDDVIKKIVAHENNINDILLVTADHGMRNGGGHGGNTDEELHVPLIAFQKHCSSKISNFRGYKQIDLTPTLAVLMGVDIPAQSIGCILPDIIQYMTLEDQLYAYLYNAMHLYTKVKSKFDQELIKHGDIAVWLTSAMQMHSEFLKNKRMENITSSFVFEKSKQNYIRASKEISQLLIESMSYFKYDFITIGIILCTLVTINSVFSVLCWDYVQQETPDTTKCLIYVIAAIIIVIIGQFSGYFSLNSLYGYLTILPISFSLYIFENILKIVATTLLFRLRRLKFNIVIPLPIAGCFLFQMISLASSSFIEEEHQIWYYFGSTLLIYLCIKKYLINLHWRITSDNRKGLETSILRGFWELRTTFATLAMNAILRRLNQTGDKWKHLKDFGDILNVRDNLIWLSVVFLIGLVMLTFLLHKLTTPIQFIISLVVLLLLYCYHGVNNVVFFFYQQHSISSYVVICIWICIIFMAMGGYKYAIFENRKRQYESNSRLIGLLQTNFACVLLISATLHKPHNVILLYALILTLKEAFWLCDGLQSKKVSWKRTSLTSLTYKVAMTIVLSKMFYFYQGNSNSLATIDLNPGFIGQAAYNPFFAVLFITLNTYSSQINAFLYLFLHICLNYHKNTMKSSKKGILDEYVEAAEITEEDIQDVTLLFTTIALIRTNFYLVLLLLFRHHLFIYSVFSPKALYESFNITSFYLSYCLTNLYFYIVKHLKLIRI